MAGSRKCSERPKSPRRTLPRNTAYCTGSGRSSPSSRATRAYSLRGASGGSSSGTGSPDSRMTTKTTVETSQRATRARSSREPRNVTSERMEAAGAPRPRPVHLLRALELEVEAPDLERLVGVRRPVHVLLQPVVLVGLHDRDPREVLEDDRGHLLVGLRAELLVDREARGLAQLVPALVAPVILGPARRQQPPHHAVGIAERRGRVGPPHALEALVAVLLRAHRVLDDLGLGVDAGIAPHGH